MPADAIAFATSPNASDDLPVPEPCRNRQCWTICRRVERLANDGINGSAAVQRDRDMRFLGAVRALLRGFQHSPLAGSTAWIAVLVVVSVIWSVNGSTCHFGAIALPSAHRTMVRRSASAVVAAQVTRIRFTMLRTVRHSSRIRRAWRGKHGIMGNPRNNRNLLRRESMLPCRKTIRNQGKIAIIPSTIHLWICGNPSVSPHLSAKPTLSVLQPSV